MAAFVIRISIAPKVSRVAFTVFLA